jgi:outer membrane protein
LEAGGNRYCLGVGFFDFTESISGAAVVSLSDGLGVAREIRMKQGFNECIGSKIVNHAFTHSLAMPSEGLKAPLHLFAWVLISTLLLTPIANGQDLLSVYQEALQDNPQLDKAREGLEAVLESQSQAGSALFLPEANFSANVNRDYQNIQYGGVGAIGVGGRSNFMTGGYSLTITQPILHYDRWVALDQADSRIAQAEADNSAAEIGLMLKLAERYFDVLAAQENLKFAQAQQQSLQRKLTETKQRQAVGFLAMTDVQEAQSGYDRAVADAVTAEHELRDAREGLQEVTGIYHDQLDTLNSDIPLIEPEPAEEQRWIELALTQNLGLQAQDKAVQVAKDEIQKQSAGHLPTLDAVGNHIFATSGGRFGTADIEDDVIGLNLNLPIYQGGRTNSKTREAEHRYRQALATLNEQKRAVHRSTSKAYLGVVAGISRVKALQQALKSAETGLAATQAGFNVGRRTALDIIVSERELLGAQRDYARARYDYLLDSLRLKQAVGSLSPNDLQQVNHWLIPMGANSRQPVTISPQPISQHP